MQDSRASKNPDRRLFPVNRDRCERADQRQGRLSVLRLNKAEKNGRAQQLLRPPVKDSIEGDVGGGPHTREGGLQFRGFGVLVLRP